MDILVQLLCLSSVNEVLRDIFIILYKNSISRRICSMKKFFFKFPPEKITTRTPVRIRKNTDRGPDTGKERPLCVNQAGFKIYKKAIE